MSGVVYQNSSSLAVSRTGAVAAFYPRRKPTPALVYRISRDRGRTWEPEEHVCPEGMLPSANSIGLRDGGVIKNIGLGITHVQAFPGETPASAPAAPPTVFRYGRLVFE